MTPWLRKIHKWVGLIVGVQLLLWTTSGFVMSLLDHDAVEGKAYRASAPAARAWPPDALAPAQVVAAAATKVQTLTTGWLLDRPVYHLSDSESARTVDAMNGAAIEIDATLASALAAASYAGPGKPATSQRLDKTLEVRNHDGPLWRVDFSDANDTTVYLSAQTGRVLEHRNKTWRLFDVFWMLHIMDYAGRKNFNNPLVVTMAVGGLWLALTGIWLLVASFHWHEFVPQRFRRRRELAVYAPDGTRLSTLASAVGDSVYVAMARQGLHLPSNCGGGQSCGLCEVRVRGVAPPPTAADRAHLTGAKLKQGYRLACNLHPSADMRIEVDAGAGLWTRHTAIVEHVDAVTPFLREIRLRMAQAPGPEFRPGAYVQIHVPEYALQRADVLHPEHHREDWAALDLPAALTNKKPVRRSHSLAMPVERVGGCLILLARFSPNRAHGKQLPAGKGSTWLYSLKPGDQVHFSGPFGDFALKPGGREKVFIGAGAGMAPLRAMLHACLDTGAKERIHFWYGARSLRDTPYIEEMEALAATHRNFSWHLVVSGETNAAFASAQGQVHEVVQEMLLSRHPYLQACDFYLCGPPAMLTATRALLRELGVAEEQVAFDDFKI
ncbi:MAG: 2Fe-2S iron-sulfur cluster binding domain-containing protein [Rudaea sp.]|nr:2Fe-2S iron-sulfur cluster binding domain-containing protein [Rudaea sp.]